MAKVAVGTDGVLADFGAGCGDPPATSNRAALGTASTLSPLQGAALRPLGSGSADVSARLLPGLITSPTGGTDPRLDSAEAGFRPPCRGGLGMKKTYEFWRGMPQRRHTLDDDFNDQAQDETALPAVVVSGTEWPEIVVGSPMHRVGSAPLLLDRKAYAATMPGAAGASAPRIDHFPRCPQPLGRVVSKASPSSLPKAADAPKAVEDSLLIAPRGWPPPAAKEGVNVLPRFVKDTLQVRLPPMAGEAKTKADPAMARRRGREKANMVTHLHYHVHHHYRVRISAPEALASLTELVSDAGEEPPPGLVSTPLSRTSSRMTPSASLGKAMVQ